MLPYRQFSTSFNPLSESPKLIKKEIAAKSHTTFSYSLLGATPKQNSTIQEFCRLLKEAELLKVYTYTGKPDYKVELKLSDEERRYLNGTWLENYAKVEVERFIQENYPDNNKYDYQALPNVEILLQTGKKTELDLFFAVGKKLFCIEAKSRLDLSKIQTCLDLYNSIGLTNHQILFVSLTDEETCKKLSQKFSGVSIANIKNFEETLTSMLKAAI